MNAPKVSVIIPNYNHASFLRQRIDSVLAQTFQDFELIILDDHSADESRDIIRQYVNHPRVSHILLSDQNSGNPFQQWKRGIAAASGDWIWIAESDDYADERLLEKFMAALPGHDNVGLIYCDSRIVTGNTVTDKTFAQLKNEKFNTTRWGNTYFNTGVAEIENYLLPGGTINNASAVLFNRKILTAANPFDINFRYIGDKYAFIKVLAVSNVLYVNESLNYYRNPFNTKHMDRFIYYFYEQFLVFNWVYRHVQLSNRKKFFNGFNANTRNSIFRGWNSNKVTMYRKLFAINPYLFFRSIVFNLLGGIVSPVRRIRSKSSQA